MSNPSNGLIVFADGTKKPFVSISPKVALAKAALIVQIRGWTKRNQIKAGVDFVRFRDRIIYPLKHKRTRDKRRNKQMDRDRPACAAVLISDIGRRRHMPRAA